jgi:hypothetical protein
MPYCRKKDGHDEQSDEDGVDAIHNLQREKRAARDRRWLREE